MNLRLLSPRRRVFGVLAILAAAWILFITVSIAREPQPGASSLESLRSRTAEAVRTGDAEDLTLLFEPDTVTDDYAKTYLERLKDYRGDAQVDVEIEESDGARLLVLRVNTGRNGPACTAWNVVRADDKWHLDGVPAVAAVSRCR